MKAKILQIAAKLLAGITKSEFKEIVDEIVTVDQNEASGAEKFKEVVSRVKNRFPKAFWIIQTVVQIAFAYAKIKNILPKKS